MQMTIGFELWFVVGCFIADEYFFVSECFWRLCSEGWGEWIGWFDWMRGWLGIGRRCSYARAYARSRTRSFVFCCHKCHSGWNWEYFIIPKTTHRFIESDVWFCWKQRVVLLKTTCRFTENNVSFYWKHRVVLLKTSYRFVESDGLFWMGGRKVVLRMVFWGVFGVE